MDMLQMIVASKERWSCCSPDWNHLKLCVTDIIMVGIPVYPFSGCANLFSTCSLENIRVWNSATNQELLRIHVPNFECNALEITRDGKSIISGKWKSFLSDSIVFNENSIASVITELSQC